MTEPRLTLENGAPSATRKRSILLPEGRRKKRPLPGCTVEVEEENGGGG